MLKYITALTILAGSALAFNLVSYGGRTESVEDGSHTIVFAIYRTETEGTPLWEETHKDVQITDGIFNVILGGISPIPALVWNGDVWIETRIDGKVLSKRNPIVGALESTTTTSLAWTEGTQSVGDGHSLDAADGDPVDAVYVDNDGNIGIGTTNPGGVKLHIKSADPGIRLEESDQKNKLWAIWGYNSGLMFSEAGVANRAYIKEGGNVGIGTTTPTEKLHVDGNVHITGGLTKAYTTGTSNLAIPVAYGVIKHDGTVFSATPNVSCTWHSTKKHYEITIADEYFFLQRDVAVVTPMPISTPFKAAIAQIDQGASSPGQLAVSLHRYSDGEKVQCAFHFVVYKGEQIE